MFSNVYFHATSALEARMTASESQVDEVRKENAGKALI
jgi:hypothetical protein